MVIVIPKMEAVNPSYVSGFLCINLPGNELPDIIMTASVSVPPILCPNSNNNWHLRQIKGHFLLNIILSIQA